MIHTYSNIFGYFVGCILFRLFTGKLLWSSSETALSMKETLSNTDNFESSVKQRLANSPNSDCVDNKDGLVSLIISMPRVDKVCRHDTESLCNDKYVNPHVSVLHMCKMFKITFQSFWLKFLVFLISHLWFCYQINKIYISNMVLCCF